MAGRLSMMHYPHEQTCKEEFERWQMVHTLQIVWGNCWELGLEPFKKLQEVQFDMAKLLQIPKIRMWMPFIWQPLVSNPFLEMI